jgi:hypothetical protein
VGTWGLELRQATCHGTYTVPKLATEWMPSSTYLPFKNTSLPIFSDLPRAQQPHSPDARRVATWKVATADRPTLLATPERRGRRLAAQADSPNVRGSQRQAEAAQTQQQ